mgnify:CR=1 FL=1
MCGPVGLAIKRIRGGEDGVSATVAEEAFVPAIALSPKTKDGSRTPGYLAQLKSQSHRT